MPIQEDFPVMLAKPFNPRKVKSWPVGVELKLDGVRGLIQVKHVTGKDEVSGEEFAEYEITTFSRQGNIFTSVRGIEDAILDVFAESGITEDYVFDGEFYAGTYSRTVSQIKRKNEEAKDAVFHIFDMIPLRHFNEAGTDQEYHIRRAKLKSFFAAAGIEQMKKLHMSRAVMANNVDEVMALYAKARETVIPGADCVCEGVIIKEVTGPMSLWVGKRSAGWMKIKDRETIDLKIVGAELGKADGKYKETLGNLVCALPPDEAFPNRPATVDVGTGITDKERHELWALHQQGKLVNLTVELDYHEFTPDGSLRHPVFKHLRIDK